MGFNRLKVKGQNSDFNFLKTWINNLKFKKKKIVYLLMQRKIL